ncbi:MAG TPA: membrane protein insertase YidC, partial [Pontiella sp.]
VLMIPLWTYIDRTYIAPKYPAQIPAVQSADEQVPTKPPALTNERLDSQDATLAAGQEVAEVPTEEITAVLHNGKVQLEVTSLGGGIKAATLLEFPEHNEKDSDPVVLDFSDAPALVYDSIDGIGASQSLALQKSDDDRSATFSGTLASGIVFQRTLAFANDDYLLTVKDRFFNPENSSITIDRARILTGRMQNPVDTKTMKGISILGVDSYTPAGGINYWGRKLHKLYGKSDALVIDTVPADMTDVKVDWVSAKNKFFTQILRPEEPAATMAILSSREAGEKKVVPETVSAALTFINQPIPAGESLELNYSYYIGPKDYSILRDSGYAMEKVMEFETTGFWSGMNWLMEPSRKFLLWTMNKFYGLIPNYGLAIILLTLLIRILFWPLTHKSTESMKRMQELQPEIKALQEKYKKEPQRLQQETMKLYKEKKVNPMGGCLPMFVQIPVFIALFTVLRNAIELRFSGFLWIADLSQPENLFAGSVPFVGALNILPIVMSLSMIWQQKLSSPATAATPEQQQQQKMMMIMMPIMMLFFFYTMPSGLVLYWTTSNLLMIAQTGLRNLKKKAKA